MRRQTFFQCFKLCLKLSYQKSRLTKMEKKGEIHTKGKRYCYADFWISITQSMSKNYRKHNFTLIYSLTTQVKHGILSLQLIRKKAGEFMTQSKDTSAKEFDALFRSLEERYQMGELAILRALASIDSNDSDPPKKSICMKHSGMLPSHCRCHLCFEQPEKRKTPCASPVRYAGGVFIPLPFPLFHRSSTETGFSNMQEKP